MALAERATLIAEISLQDKMSGTLGRIEGKLGRFRQVTNVALGVGLQQVVAKGIRVMTDAFTGGVEALKEDQVAAAQTAAVLKSTGGAAKVTAAGIDALTQSLQDKVAVDDAVIRSGANMLLTFTNIRNEAGAGNNIFDQSVAILADMSQALGQDMSKSAIQLGKALNDPVKGVTALQRVGVTFDAGQKKRIAQYIKEGKVTKAQGIILAELAKEFGGSGKAFADTAAGMQAKLGFAVEDLQKAFAQELMPTILEVTKSLTAFLKDPSTIEAAKGLGKTIAGLFSRDNLAAIASAGKALAGIFSTAASFFGAMPEWAKALLVGGFAANVVTGGGVTGLLKGGIDLVFKGRGTTPANPMFVADVTGGLGGGGIAGKGGKGLLGTLTSAPVIIGGAALVTALAATWEGVIMPGLQEQANQNNQNLTNELKTGSLADLQQSLKGLEEMPSKLDPLQRVLYELNAAGVKTHTEALEAAIRAEIASRKTRETTQTTKLEMPTNRPAGEHAGAANLPGAVGVIQRAVAHGKEPTNTAVVATLRRNEARTREAADETRKLRIAQAVASRAQTLAAAFGFMSVVSAVNGVSGAVRGLNMTPVVNVSTGFTVATTVSVRDLNTKTVVATSYNTGRRTTKGRPGYSGGVAD